MKVKVVNKNSHPYKEEFKGDKITIPANGHVEMERDDAVLFLGTMNSILRDVDGNPDPRSFKRLFIEPIEEKKAQK